MSEEEKTPKGGPKILPFALPHKVPLMTPIEVFSTDGELLEKYTFLTYKRKPNAGDLMATDNKGDVGKTLKLISLLTGTPMSVVRRIDPTGDDLINHADTVAAFFE